MQRRLQALVERMCPRGIGHLDEHVGISRGEPLCAAPPMSNSVELNERPAGGCKLENGLRIEAARVVDERVSRIGDAHDLWDEAVPICEPRRLHMHSAEEPLADRPEPDELERMLAGSGYQERRRTLQGEGRPPGEEPADHPHDP